MRPFGKTISEDEPRYASKVQKHKSRGTTDELEIIKMILKENKGLYVRVLEKVRTLRDLAEYHKTHSKKKDVLDV